MAIEAFEVLTRYSPVLLAAAAVLALAASQAILIFTDRVCRTAGLTGWWWLAASSVMLGISIWSISVLRQIALLPGPSYRFGLGAGALGAVIVVAATAWWLAMQKIRWPLGFRLASAVAITAPALATMHLLVLTATGTPTFVGGTAAIATALALTAAASTALFLLAARFSSASDGRPWLGSLTAVITMLLMAAGIYLELLFPTSNDQLRVPRADGLVASRESVIAWAVVVLIALVSVALGAHLDRRVRRQHAETVALRRSEDRFRSLVQASAQIVWTTTPDGLMKGEQPSWHEFTGQERESFSGAGWFNAIHPEDRETTARIWEETLGARASAEFEHRLRRHDGQYRRCVVRVVPVLDRDGSVREWVGTHTDVSERSRIQDERDLLSEVGKVLSTSLDYRETLSTVGRLLVPQMATWCAVDVLEDEAGLERVATAHDDARIAELLQHLNLPESGEAVRAVIHRVVELGESVLLRRSADDVLGTIATRPEHRAALEGVGITSILWVPLSSRGTVIGVMTLASARDGRQYDLRDLALAEELARRSANAVDNARLYARAREAVRARDEVLGMVSHDLRNPIATISMTSELLLDLSLEPAEQRKHLEIIRRTVKGLNRFIQDLLDVSQTESGQLALDRQRVEPAALIREACEMMQPLIEAESQRLECMVERDLPAVDADPVRVQQVLSNLLGNSLKFAGSGGLIRIEVRRHEEGVRFSVIDNGPGVAPEALPRLFDRHWRARETAHLGAGLGLAIARGIVEAHQGRIWVESEIGKGTAFHFTMPLAAETPVPDRRGGDGGATTPETEGGRGGSQRENREPDQAPPAGQRLEPRDSPPPVESGNVDERAAAGAVQPRVEH